MTKEVLELQKEAELLFEQEKFKEVIDILQDELLEKNKDAQLYTLRARSHYSLGDDSDKVIYYAQKAIDVDGNYFMAYKVKGSAWDRKGEYDKAISDYTKVIELKPDYKSAYFNRGNSWDDKGEYDKAIADYNKTIELKPDDAETYNNRGITWKRKGEYDKAIADYTKAVELKPDYASAYYNRGNSWYNKGGYDKAIADYHKALELQPDDRTGYYNLALSYEQIEDYKNAITNFEKAIEFNNRTEDAKWKINSIKEKLHARLDKETENAITKIKAILNVIRKICRSGDNLTQVVHYSKLSVADIIANDCHSCLHYSNAIYMNDPEEGITFLKYLDDEEIQKWFDIQSRKNESTIFLGSFLPLQEGDKNQSDTLGSSEDQLLMWRTYGKDEDGVDAAGCNFVINTSFFKDGEDRASNRLPNTFAKIKSDIEKGVKLIDDREDTNGLLKVQYIRNDRKILNDNKDLLKQLIDYFKTEIRKLIEQYNNSNSDATAKIYTDKSIYNAIQELSHLFKSSDYSFENEVRVIRSESRNSLNIQYYKGIDGKEPKSPRHFYVKSGYRILPYLDKIFLGPKVKDPRHWSLHFDFSFRKAANIEKEEFQRIIFLETQKNISENESKELESLKKIYIYSEDIATVKKIEPDQIEIIPSKCRFT